VAALYFRGKSWLADKPRGTVCISVGYLQVKTRTDVVKRVVKCLRLRISQTGSCVAMQLCSWSMRSTAVEQPGTSQ